MNHIQKNNLKVIIMDWVNKSQKWASGRHTLERLKNAGIDLNNELNDMSGKQLRLVLAMIVVGSNTGHELQREWRAEAKKREEVQS